VETVARCYGVVRQTVHTWIRRYPKTGLASLADRSTKPGTCPHQMAPEIKARVIQPSCGRRPRPLHHQRTLSVHSGGHDVAIWALWS